VVVFDVTRGIESKRAAPTALRFFASIRFPAFTDWANLWRTYGAKESYFEEGART
jgi:hypothetical protein